MRSTCIWEHARLVCYDELTQDTKKRLHAHSLPQAMLLGSSDSVLAVPVLGLAQNSLQLCCFYNLIIQLYFLDTPHVISPSTNVKPMFIDFWAVTFYRYCQNKAFPFTVPHTCNTCNNNRKFPNKLDAWR